MFCSQCGKPLPEDAKFCQSCGTPVFETASDSTLVLQKNSELDVQEEVPTQMVGTFYSGLLNSEQLVSKQFLCNRNCNVQNTRCFRTPWRR